MRMAKIIARVLAASALSGCVTMMTIQKAKPDNEGEVQKYKYGIFDATAAWINEEGFVVVCTVGIALGEEDVAYSLVLRTRETGLVGAQISRDQVEPKGLPEYNMAPREIGEPCKYPPPGPVVELIAMEIPEPEYIGHTPVTKSELLDRLNWQEKPTGLAVVKVKREEYCAEVIVWNPAAKTTDIEFVRISTPMEERTITGNRAWYLLMPFTILVDVATLPLQPVFFGYLFAEAFGKGHMTYC